MQQKRATIKPLKNVFDFAEQIKDTLHFDWNAFLYHGAIALAEKHGIRYENEIEIEEKNKAETENQEVSG